MQTKVLWWRHFSDSQVLLLKSKFHVMSICQCCSQERWMAVHFLFTYSLTEAPQMKSYPWCSSETTIHNGSQLTENAMFSSPTLSCWTPLLLWILETPPFLWKTSSVGFLNFLSSGSSPSSDWYSLFSFFSLFFASSHALTCPLNLNIHRVLSCVSPALPPSSPRPLLHSCNFCSCPCVDGSQLHISGSKHSQAPGPRV